MTTRRNDTGTYRIIRPSELTEEQRQILSIVSQRRVIERIAHLIGDGQLAVSQVQARYGALMGHVGISY
jgi:hypothetical protein